MHVEIARSNYVARVELQTPLAAATHFAYNVSCCAGYGYACLLITYASACLKRGNGGSTWPHVARAHWDVLNGLDVLAKRDHVSSAKPLSSSSATDPS